LALLGVLVLIALPAWAEPRDRAQAISPAQARQSLLLLAQQNHVAHYTRRCGNEVERVYLNPSGMSELAALSRFAGPNSNVLQICHIDPSDVGQPGLMHSLAMYDGKFPHFQYRSGSNNWRLRSWGGGLRPSHNRLYSAFVQLTPSEGARLREMLTNAEREQGPEQTAGANWENGHVRGALGNRGFNCTSVWSGMPVGDRGESLAQLCGLGGASGSPHGFQQELETRANERVIAIGVYGPDLRGFADSPQNKNHTFAPR
jgi:hypothetical protein